MAFPGPHDRVIYNEAGEPLGWESTAYDDEPNDPYEEDDRDAYDDEEDDDTEPDRDWEGEEQERADLGPFYPYNTDQA